MGVGVHAKIDCSGVLSMPRVPPIRLPGSRSQAERVVEPDAVLRVVLWASEKKGDRTLPGVSSTVATA